MLSGEATKTSNNVQFYNLWSDQTGAQTHDLPHLW